MEMAWGRFSGPGLRWLSDISRRRTCTHTRAPLIQEYLPNKPRTVPVSRIFPGQQPGFVKMQPLTAQESPFRIKFYVGKCDFPDQPGMGRLGRPISTRIDQQYAEMKGRPVLGISGFRRYLDVLHWRMSAFCSTPASEIGARVRVFFQSRSGYIFFNQSPIDQDQNFNRDHDRGEKFSTRVC